DIDTALQVTGKVAQFGRGVMAEVSAKLLKQFVDNLERDVLSAAAPEPVVSATEPAAPTTPTTGSANGNGNAPAVTSTANGRGGVRVIDSPEAEPVNLMDAAGASVAKRAVPFVVGVLLLFIVARRWRRRRNRGNGSA